VTSEAGRAPRELRIPTRRVPHPDTASSASAHGESSDPARADLAARQAALVDALVAGGPVPAGFDPDHLAGARRALVRKRAGAAAAQWPLLAASLGPDWPAVFAASVAARPPTTAFDDGWELARALHGRGELGDSAAVELAEREVSLRRTDAGGHARRRLPAARWAGRRVVVQLARRVRHLSLR
jgi:hypothetical protein